MKWAALQKNEVQEADVASWEWPCAVDANHTLANLLLTVTSGKPNCIVDQCGDRGFEAWRQLSQKYNRSDEIHELERISQLIIISCQKALKDVPQAVHKWENESVLNRARTK